jgi:hypothetical protein
MAVPNKIDQLPVVGKPTFESINPEITMKTIIISILGLAALGFSTSCTTVESREPSTHTTTTTGIAPATYGTVETKTTRRY